MPEGIGLPGGDWLAIARLAGMLIGGYFLVLWFASILWVYRDIRARTNDPISQAIGVAIAVVFPILGLPVYFVLRPSETLQEAYDRQLEQEAILSDLHAVSACPDCRRPVTDDFMVCAYCGTQLRQPCTSCSHLLQFAWRYCPICAAPQPRRQAAARTASDGASEAPARAPASAEEPDAARDPAAPRAGGERRTRAAAGDGAAATSRRTATAEVETDDRPRTRRALADEGAASQQP